MGRRSTPESKAKAEEVKRDRFIRVATQRVVGVIESIKKLGACADHRSYVYTQEQVDTIFRAIETEMQAVRSIFTTETGRTKVFSLEADTTQVQKRCPKCGCTTFHVSAHVVQDWEVNANGAFQKVIDDCIEVTHFPDDQDIWDCACCGYSQAGSAFNITNQEVQA